ncbi:MAG: bifunctional ornithine acetyltransferase/N-acetylglutamate synthase [Planctomycetota bacterium]|nr:MAG: bifunctional ornithine acetyltransferase/N-acetylglutamate synthase [Planctomycetota bacterium]
MKVRGIEFVDLFRSGGSSIGLKDSGKPDLGIILCEDNIIGTGVFTTNKVRAAPVKICEEHLKINSKIKAVVVNSGNANACTGDEGYQNAIRMCSLVADKLKCNINEVLVCSTGIIGEQLDMLKIEKGIPDLIEVIKTSSPLESFTNAILTTDLVIKVSESEFSIKDKKYKIGGCTKGSGMIHPNMATMLGFIVTDFHLPKNEINKILKWCVDRSFNCLSVDGDTSTNDSVILLSPENNEISANDIAIFKEHLLVVCKDLAKQIAIDGEGAKHLIKINVRGALNFAEAKNVANSVGKSPLVKTAFAGEDPNWGRILCAIGYSGENIDESKISISLEGVEVYNGKPLDFDYDLVTKKLQNKEIDLSIYLNNGQESIEFYTCDLTHGYIEINADYHT